MSRSYNNRRYGKVRAFAAYHRDHAHPKISDAKCPHCAEPSHLHHPDDCPARALKFEMGNSKSQTTP